MSYDASSLHPLNALVNGRSAASPVPAKDIAAYQERVYYAVAANDVTSIDLPNTRFIILLGNGTASLFAYDSTSSAAHDGTSVLASSDGRRFVLSTPWPASGTISAAGPISEQSSHDAESEGFVFAQTDHSSGDLKLYVKLSDTSGDWSGAFDLRGEAQSATNILTGVTVMSDLDGASGMVCDFTKRAMVIRDATDATKDFADAPEEKLTVSRGSVKYVVGADGLIASVAVNTLAYVYDSLTGAGLGVLIEGAASNLLTYTEDFTNAAWSTVNGSFTANVATAPDGAGTGDRFIEDTATGQHRFNQTATILSGNTYNFSLWIKANGSRTYRVYLRDSATTNYVHADFDLSAKTVSAITTGGAGAAGRVSIEEYSNDWFRVSLSGAVNAGVTTLYCSLFCLSGGGESYTGDGTSGVYAWGAQLEGAPAATSYIKRLDATAASRAADSVTLPVSNTAFSNSYGTLIVHFGAWNDLTSFGDYLAVIDDGDTSDRVLIRNSTPGNYDLNAVISSSSVTSAGAGPFKDYATGAGGKAAITWALNDFEGVVDGASQFTDTAGAVPVGLSTLRIGSGPSGNNWSGIISKVMLLPYRASQAEMITKTS